MSGRITLLAFAVVAWSSFVFANPGLADGAGSPGNPRNPRNTGNPGLTRITRITRNTGNTGNPDTLPVRQVVQLYRQADHLFHLPNSTPFTDSTALAGFERVIGDLERSPGFRGKDSLIFQSWLKKGILLDSRYNYEGARNAYRSALQFHPEIDSLAFVTYVYVGASYYNLNNFDSANYFLLRAERMGDHFHDREDEVRLYNTLGVLYFENGDYQQGKNYFERALEITDSKKPVDTAFSVSLQSNIATSYYHLGLFRESLAIYNKILAYRLFTDPIYMNRGMAYASLDKYKEALASFRKVNAAKMPGVLNEMAYAQLQLRRPDSSAWFLDRWRQQAGAGPQNGLDQGTNELYRADLFAGRQQYRFALHSLQEAIIRFSRNFNNEDIFSNPSNFTGMFASYRLFDALSKKAAFFERWSRFESNEVYLLAAFEAYKSALSILRYIEKSYDTDDAKLFLKKRNSEIVQAALTVCLELYRRHPGGNYLEQAFSISERNKASVIMANLQQSNFRKLSGVTEGLLQKERNIKYNIARLNAKSDELNNGEGNTGIAGGKGVEMMAREKAGYEIELSQVQKELENNDQYYRLKYEDAAPGTKELQLHLNDHQALISFYITAESLHIFMLTKTSFNYTRIDSLPVLRQDVADGLTALQATGDGHRFKGETYGSRLYRQLILPIQRALPKKDEWIIIPDGFLYFLPFESLPAGMGSTTLLETTTISYQFSSRLVANPAEAGNNGSSGPNAGESDLSVLAFAPFATHGASFDPPDSTRFVSLPASREEIEGLPGRQYLDSGATKQRFLQELNKYPIVHLATHAVSSINNASASFIAFYPRYKFRTEDCLFLEELYGLDLSATKLVVISACETGQGELVSNEGVISLARAFAYAGCGSSISSLWKADDRSTSFILRKFYAYLEKGYPKSKALRQAKLDYLSSDAIDKSPAYWSHLMFFGNDQPLYTKKYPWFWGISILLVGVFLGVLRHRQRKRKKKSTLFMDSGF